MNPLNYNRYSYVLNNPLKYTDPSGYIFRYRGKEDQAWVDGMNYYYAMMDIMDGYYGRYGGGGGGGSSYGSRISAMGGDPRGWHYNSSTETYWSGRTGVEVDARDPHALDKMGVPYYQTNSKEQAVAISNLLAAGIDPKRFYKALKRKLKGRTY